MAILLVHSTLDEMKNSLSFISTKLATNQTRQCLTQNEITQLQQRLIATESQMYRILDALDIASNQVQELTKNKRQLLERTPSQVYFDYDNEMLIVYFVRIISRYPSIAMTIIVYRRDHEAIVSIL
jgi:predicted  nucleic acid-binding Zn-ribbon protein